MSKNDIKLDYYFVIISSNCVILNIVHGTSSNDNFMKKPPSHATDVAYFVC
jgi:hypothetical protein